MTACFIYIYIYIFFLISRTPNMSSLSSGGTRTPGWIPLVSRTRRHVVGRPHIAGDSTPSLLCHNAEKCIYRILICSDHIYIRHRPTSACANVNLVTWRGRFYAEYRPRTRPHLFTFIYLLRDKYFYIPDTKISVPVFTLLYRHLIHQLLHAISNENCQWLSPQLHSLPAPCSNKGPFVLHVI